MKKNYTVIQIAGEIFMLGYCTMFIVKKDNNIILRTESISDGGQYSDVYEREYKNKDFSKILEKVRSIKMTESEDDSDRLNWGISIFNETKDSLDEEPLYGFGFWPEKELNDLLKVIKKTMGNNKAINIFEDFINF